MGKVVLYSSVSVDGFVADENDQPGPLFDWLSSGDALAHWVHVIWMEKLRRWVGGRLIVAPSTEQPLIQRTRLLENTRADIEHISSNLDHPQGARDDKTAGQNGYGMPLRNPCQKNPMD